MGGLELVYTSLLGKASELSFVNTIGQTVIPYVNIWNDQLNYERENITYPLPAVFVEIIVNELNGIGQGYDAGDVNINFHIISEMLDGGNGTFEQNLYAIKLRDSLRRQLRNYAIPGCSSFLDYVNEQADYSHDNVYHYQLQYVAHMIDTTGSDFDETVPLTISTTPPTTLSLTITKAE